MAKLLVIGNGFDLHLGLKSSFDDFFESSVFKQHSNYQEFSNNNFAPRNFIRSFEGVSKEDRIINIKYTTEYPFSHDFKAEQYAQNKINDNKIRKVNFWATYFKILRCFPNYNNEDDSFKSSVNPSISLERWSDIEYQIYKLLVYTEMIIDKYVNCVEVSKKDPFESDSSNLKKVVENYESAFFNDNDITYIGVLRLMVISIALSCGWNPLEDDFYSFLFEELKQFENIFNEYLQDDWNKHSNYRNEATKFASDLVNGYDYDLINFNYTYFYEFDNPHRINIHSTLNYNNNDHPIFGITSYNDVNNTEEDLISNKVYYRFTKVYRIMSQSQNNIDKQILPSHTDEIIFYGHSFAQADYSYFDAIFDHYHIYDDSSNIHLTFKFSNYINKITNQEVNTEIDQISSVYKLINQFAQRIDRPNLLQKLLLENRISFKRVL